MKLYLTDMPDPADVPEITVLMAVHNGLPFLNTAVESVLKQTFHDLEFLIVDDGSTDGSADFLKRIGDLRVRLLSNERNLGLAESLNVGLAAARGTYVARMDSDDICYPQRLARQAEFLRAHPDVGVCGSWIRCFGGANHTLPLPGTDADIRSSLFFFSPVAHPAVMFRRADFVRHGLRYNPVWKKTEDYELWTRAVDFMKFANLPETLLLYRVHDRQVSTVGNPERLSEHRSLMRRQMEAWGLTVNESDLSLHEDFAHGRLPEDPSRLRALRAHLERLLKTARNRPGFPAGALRRVIAGRYSLLIIRRLKEDRLSFSCFLSLIRTALVPRFSMLALFRKYLSLRIRG